MPCMAAPLPFPAGGSLASPNRTAGLMEFLWPPPGPLAPAILNLASPLQMGRTFSQGLRSLKGTQGCFLCGLFTKKEKRVC